MPIYEAADKALKTFQEEFMPVETFSEFLDVAGQCQGVTFQRSSAAKPTFVLVGWPEYLSSHTRRNIGEN